MRRLLLLLICTLLLIPCTYIFAQDEDAPLPPEPEWLTALDGEPCPDDSAFTCVTLTVPLDYANPDSGETIDVVFAVLPAGSGDSRGLFVTATGGPGSAGIGLADYYSSYFADEIFENFDIVFYDQRGIGLSGGLDCPLAVTAYTLDESRPTTPEGEAGTIASAQTFAADCMSEMGSPAILPYIGTEQSVQDLEAFRQAAGDQRMWLYGESYGTQYAQTYAAMYPDVIEGLILDGVVDLSLTGHEFYVQQAQAFSDTLAASLNACNADADCAFDFGTDALAFYDDLAAELATAPVIVNYPLADGTTEARPFTLSMLETIAISNVYGPDYRSVFLRELAAATRGDLLPLLRDFYVSAGVDPFTYEPVIDPTYFTSMYYAVECNDYKFFDGTPDERAAAMIEAGNAADVAIPRLSFIYYTDLPCIFWNSSAVIDRPAPFTGGDYVTFILNSSTDPATPTSNGYAVFDSITAAGNEAYMITMEGGPHVLFGREDTCPDVAITYWVVDDILPASREYICAGSVIDEYVPLNPASVSGYDSTLDAIRAVDEEIQFLPEYGIWDLEDDLIVGCNYGGTLTISLNETEDGEGFILDNCAMIDNFPLTGTVSYLWDVERTFEVADAENPDNQIVYTLDLGTNMYTISGSWNGEPITTPRLLY